MEKNNILISLIVATRDRINDLASLLESLRIYGYFKRTGFEVIIVDNSYGSDELKELCRHYGAKYSLESCPGKSRALNKGIGISSGQYLAFTDDDIVVRDNYSFDILARDLKDNENIGYVSGNVIAAKIVSSAQKIWETKGGLSKGKSSKLWTNDEFASYRFSPWPLFRICAGANCMIPRKVLDQVGGYSELLGPGAMIGHGESLEIGYRIIKSGYEMKYNSESCVYHNHPAKDREIKSKLYIYGIGDTAIHAHIFWEFFDLRSLWWAFIGHPAYTMNKFLKRWFGKYPLPSDYILYSLAGSLMGATLYLSRRIGLRR